MVFKKNSEPVVEVEEQVSTPEPETKEKSLDKPSKDLRATYIDSINAICSSIQSQIDSLYKIRTLLQNLSDDE